jgi:spore coat protein U-like protein
MGDRLMVKFIPLVIVGVGLTAASSAMADCASTTITPKEVTHQNYDPFDDVTPTHGIVRLVNNADRGTCSGVLLFVHANPDNARLSSAMNYDLTTNPAAGAANILAPSTVDDSSEQAQAVTVNAGETVDFDFYFDPDAAQILSPGSYREAVKVRLYSGLSALGAKSTPEEEKDLIIEEKDLIISATVKESVYLTLAGVNAAKELDFGTFADGATKDVVLSVRSNTNYDIDLESRFKGHIRNIRNLRSTASVDNVDYRATIDGSANLVANGSGSLKDRSASTDIRGAAHTMRITLGDPADKHAGDYEDELTITVTQKL